MGKIAVTLQQALARRERDGARGGMAARALARGAGWDVADMLCTFGPRDQPFEERHAGVCIAMVVAGSFDYRAAPGRELLTPGALLLGNTGECFECGHRHGAGDRCIAFRYAPAYFERLAADAGVSSGQLNFRGARIPSQRAMSPLLARACAGARMDPDGAHDVVWNELAIELAAATLQAGGALTHALTHAVTHAAMHSQAGARGAMGSMAASRVAQIVRLIDDTPAAPHTLASLAAAAGLSEFHFLRTFRRVTGVTPHQYLLRARLRTAALQLQDGGAKVVDIALDCGFNDLSNFNHAFRAEFAATPRAWRARGRAHRS